MKLSRFKEQFPFNVSVRRIADSSWIIYFLLHENEIVYIGKSSEQAFLGRIAAHKSDKVFDSFFVVDNIESEKAALKIETGFICLIRPKYNLASTQIDVSAINELMRFCSANSDLSNIVRGEINAIKKERHKNSKEKQRDSAMSAIRNYRSAMKKAEQKFTRGDITQEQLGATLANLQGLTANQERRKLELEAQLETMKNRKA